MGAEVATQSVRNSPALTLARREYPNITNTSWLGSEYPNHFRSSPKWDSTYPVATKESYRRVELAPTAFGWMPLAVDRPELTQEPTPSWIRLSVKGKGRSRAERRTVTTTLVWPGDGPVEACRASATWHG